jgi:D-arabinose 1-dehydrogenase-like Zn-dependent alcohol dehydrogenase
MRAAVLERFSTPLVLSDVPDLEPGPGEVVVRTRAAGLCQTDVKVVDGRVPTVELPRVPGHELAGEVGALGPGVSGVSVGEPVFVGLDLTCGRCRWCRDGKLDYCDNLRRLGMEHDGALAELVRVPADNLFPVPDAVSFPQAATIPDAVGSPYHAVVYHARVGVADTVAVYGLGGLGLTAVQVARLTGATVIAIARTPERRALAEELGATWTVDPREGPVAEQIRERTAGRGVDAFLDFVGIEDSVEQGVLASRKGGHVVVVGYVVPQLTAPMTPLVYGEVSITGSRSSTRKELREALQLVADGRVRPIIGRELPLEDVNDALDELRAGKVIGRPVVTFP